MSDTPKTTDPLSVDDASLDSLVEKASVPNLAALFGQAKKQGLIQAQQEYGHTV
jgi:hypothetical protein